jgi:hypothetical protein
MSKLWVRFLFVVVLVMVLIGCNLLDSPPSGEPPAAQMLPDLPGYKVIEGQQLTGYLSNLPGGEALLQDKPELASALTTVEQMIDCYQEVGAARARIYSSESNPLSAGAVAIADRKALLSPANLFKCVGPGKQMQTMGTTIGIKPCSANYTLTRDDNEFYIIYAGTNTEICHAFCSNLEGCTAH